MINQRMNLYKDSLHGICAAAPVKSMAWMLIRNECYEKKLAVPTMDKIEFIRELRTEEVNWLYRKNK